MLQLQFTNSLYLFFLGLVLGRWMITPCLPFQSNQEFAFPPLFFWFLPFSPTGTLLRPAPWRNRWKTSTRRLSNRDTSETSVTFSPLIYYSAVQAPSRATVGSARVGISSRAKWRSAKTVCNVTENLSMFWKVFWPRYKRQFWIQFKGKTPFLWFSWLHGIYRREKFIAVIVPNCNSKGVVIWEMCNVRQAWQLRTSGDVGRGVMKWEECMSTFELSRQMKKRLLEVLCKVQR